MKISRRPMFTTIIYGLLAGTSFIPLVVTMNNLVHWTVAFRMAIWLVLAGYLVILNRWGRVNLISILFPLLLLLLLVFWGDTNRAFLFLALGVFSWVRSGVYFQGSLLKTLVAEAALCFGGGALVASFAPYSTITWALAVWMFFLVQSIYFVIFAGSGAEKEEVELDPFHQARRRAERIVSAGH